MKLLKILFGVVTTLFANASFASQASVKNNIGCKDGRFAQESSIKVDFENKSFEFSQLIAHSDILRGTGYIEVFYADDNLTIVDLFEQGKMVGTLIAIDNESWSSRLTYKTRRIHSMFCSKSVSSPEFR